ncbi:C40 family peptidase [Amycolatopsis samaneae]
MAAVAVITVVTLAQPAASAAPSPAPQTPPGNSSDALAKYRELSSQAEKMNQELLKAQDDLKAKQGELDKATTDTDAAKDAGAKAAENEKKFRTEVDKFAGASFTSGVQLNKLSSLLAGGTTQEFLERSSALDVISADKNVALGNLSGAVKQAAESTAKAADAQKRAQDARDAAAKLASDIEAKKKSLDSQVAELKTQSNQLSASDKAAQQDRGGSRPDVKAPGAAAQAAVNAALSKLGSPYVYGATGPGTFDCSGLMQWAYKQAGISLPRTADAQIASGGTRVSRDQLQPGDLVGFYSPITHIGMYIGDGKMVHAPDTGDVVKISPLQSQYAGATRPSS